MATEMATKVEPRIWDAEGAHKRRSVQNMFADIAGHYDLVNGILSLSRHKRWRRHAASMLQLKHGQRALDVCCGTGDFLLALRKLVGQSGKAIGIDFCRPMLSIAARKTDAPLALGDACTLPVQSSSFDGVTVGWGIRNVPDIDSAHREIARVLKPGGTFVSLDMAVPPSAFLAACSRFLFHNLAPKLGWIFGKKEAYTYLPKSTARFWTREQLADSMARAGFTQIRFEDLFFGNICIHYGRKPETQ